MHTDRSVGVQYGNQPPGIMSREEFVPTALRTDTDFVRQRKAPWWNTPFHGGWTLARLGGGILVLVALQVPAYGPRRLWAWCLFSPLPFISHRHNGEPEPRHFVAPPRSSPRVLAFPPQLFTMTRDGTRDCG